MSDTPQPPPNPPREPEDCTIESPGAFEVPAEPKNAEETPKPPA